MSESPFIRLVEIEVLLKTAAQRRYWAVACYDPQISWRLARSAERTAARARRLQQLTQEQLNGHLSVLSGQSATGAG